MIKKKKPQTCCGTDSSAAVLAFAVLLLVLKTVFVFLVLGLHILLLFGLFVLLSVVLAHVILLLYVACRHIRIIAGQDGYYSSVYLLFL